MCTIGATLGLTALLREYIKSRARGSRVAPALAQVEEIREERRPKAAKEMGTTQTASSKRQGRAAEERYSCTLSFSLWAQATFVDFCRCLHCALDESYQPHCTTIIGFV